jgi:hypothetical protein
MTEREGGGTANRRRGNIEAKMKGGDRCEEKIQRWSEATEMG